MIYIISLFNGIKKVNKEQYAKWKKYLIENSNSRRGVENYIKKRTIIIKKY